MSSRAGREHKCSHAYAIDEGFIGGIREVAVMIC